MITTDLDKLMKQLELARLRGCDKVKLQLYSNWDEIVREQRYPSHPEEDYKIDLRFQNTVELDTLVENNHDTGKLHAYMEDDTLILRVCISDAETLLHELNLYQNNKELTDHA